MSISWHVSDKGRVLILFVIGAVPADGAEALGWTDQSAYSAQESALSGAIVAENGPRFS